MYKKKKQEKKKTRKKKRKKKNKPRAVRAFQEQGRTRERLVPGTGPPTGDCPQKAIASLRPAMGRGFRAARPAVGGGGWCVQAGEAIAIFSLLVCGSGYPTSRDVWSGPISSRKVSMHGFEGSPLGLF
ncbi:hypothetical protein ISCGN_019628 [Ixodes scapularis]